MPVCAVIASLQLVFADVALVFALVLARHEDQAAQCFVIIVFGQGYPGVGPGVQIAASNLIPDEPAYNKIRNIVMPFGDRGFADGLAEAYEIGRSELASTLGS